MVPSSQLTGLDRPCRARPADPVPSKDASSPRLADVDHPRDAEPVHGPHSIRIDANRPGVYRWMITRDGRSVASGVAADRDQAANDAAAALGELPR
jgi:hypothetical protein